MATYELRRFDTGPPIAVPIVHGQSSGTPAIDLTNVVPVTGVHYELKGLTASLVTGVCTLGAGATMTGRLRRTSRPVGDHV